MLKVTQASALVLVQIALFVLVTRRAVRIFSGPVRVVGFDNVRQHQHILRRLALPFDIE